MKNFNEFNNLDSFFNEDDEWIELSYGNQQLTTNGIEDTHQVVDFTWFFKEELGVEMIPRRFNATLWRDMLYSFNINKLQAMSIDTLVNRSTFNTYAFMTMANNWNWHNFCNDLKLQINSLTNY